MRVIAGEFKGTRLARIKGGSIRPTSERLREALFDVLDEWVPDSVWLDPFCGSGAIGIEALSRGAKMVFFNDWDKGAHDLLRKNLELCGITRGVAIQGEAVFPFLRQLPEDPLDFVYLDPPRDFRRVPALLEKVSQMPGFSHDALILLEVASGDKPQIPEALSLERTLRAGGSEILFLRPSRASDSLNRD